ncbi:uncharacterized protein K460DRAFT_178202 [Cucurbitaria berberidis CBS 394.84]|uniref:C2H2-type domain-containing protein n=1 Tax=Cucurbitaria berberidis CBS 394.84 TaxID=1168544 RepID=A0A9P4L4Z7_9PLEO|nr:uncharacterized protein K460DRAFT_178202 [Cucurbitaria berberidis CBS 394.84]KAF1842060.1 hypothetical protein K460DRAFT_178202 [Cucurbitaria berberidis CBS 394.84]
MSDLMDPRLNRSSTNSFDSMDDDPFINNHRPALTLPLSPPRPPSPSTPRRAHKPRRTRLGLPITLNTQGVLATVLACADTGADVNIISDELAKALGHTSYETCPETKEFELANGKIVEAIGQIESSCSFGVESELSVSMTCIFYVLLRVATPIIMGMGFLEETKTMTEHRERLVRVPRPAFQALSVCSVGRPRKLMSCELDHMDTLATPDSGSEIDLISPIFAFERGLAIYPVKEAIELADGSVAITTGYISAGLSVGSGATSESILDLKSTVKVDFFVLEGLAHDLIVGEDSLEELKVFTANQNALVPAPSDHGPLELNRIRHLGAVDRIISWIKDRIRGKKPNLGSQGMSHVCTTTLPSGKLSNNYPPDLHSSFGSNIRDQRENDQREREAARIAALPINEQGAAIEAEVREQNEYDIAEQLSAPRRLPPHLPPGGSGDFRCDYPGCNAAPFQTQYILNSHANVHTSQGQDIPEAKAREGSKRKSEMLRYEPIHRAPGYVCPFCPDSEHRYPRPDSLYRHVRAHHVDKDVNDSQLRNVLAQGPDREIYGRKRRLLS